VASSLGSGPSEGGLSDLVRAALPAGGRGYPCGEGFLGTAPRAPIVSDTVE